MANRYAVVSNVATSSLMWATTSGGVATISGIANSDTLIFDANTPAGTITFDLNEVSTGLEMLAGFTGTLDMSAVTFEVSGNYPAFKVQAGTINLPSNGLVFKCRGIENTIGGVINYGTGEINSQSSATFTGLPANATLYKYRVLFGNLTLPQDLTVSNLMTIDSMTGLTGPGALICEGDVINNNTASVFNGGDFVFGGANNQTYSSNLGSGNISRIKFDKSGGNLDVQGDMIGYSGVSATAQHEANATITWNAHSVQVIQSAFMDMRTVKFQTFILGGFGVASGIGVVGVTDLYIANGFINMDVEVEGSAIINSGPGGQSGVVRFVGNKDGNCLGKTPSSPAGVGGLGFAKTGGTLTIEGSIVARGNFIDSSSGGAVLDFVSKKSDIITTTAGNWSSLTQAFWDITYNNSSQLIIGNQIVKNKLTLKGGILSTGNLVVEGDVIADGFPHGGISDFQITMSGDNNQILSGLAGTFPKSTFTIRKRRGSVKLNSAINLLANFASPFKGLDIQTDSVLDLNGFNLNAVSAIQHDGQVDNTNGGTLTSGGSITRGISSTLGNLRTNKVPGIFDRLASKTRFRTRRQIERVV